MSCFVCSGGSHIFNILYCISAGMSVCCMSVCVCVIELYTYKSSALVPMAKNKNSKSMKSRKVLIDGDLRVQ